MARGDGHVSRAAEQLPAGAMFEVDGRVPHLAASGLPVVARWVYAGQAHERIRQCASADTTVDAEGARGGVSAVGAPQRDDGIGAELKICTLVGDS